MHLSGKHTRQQALPRVKSVKSKEDWRCNIARFGSNRGRENDYEDVAVSPDLPRAFTDQVHRPLAQDQQSRPSPRRCPASGPPPFPRKDCSKSPTRILAVGWLQGSLLERELWRSSASAEPAGPRMETRLLASGSRGWDRIKMGTPWMWLPVSPLPEHEMSGRWNRADGGIT